MLLLPLVAVATGLVIGLARRGTLRAVAGTSLRRPGLLAGGVVVQAFATLVELPAGVVLIMAAHAALIAFCLSNWRLAGLTVVAIGLSANLLSIGLNGGMPVRPDALVRAGLASADDIDAGVALRGERHVETDSDRLAFLGDIVPLRLTRQVLSFGDLIVLVGLADVAMNLTLRRRDDTRPSVGDVMRLDPFARPVPNRTPGHSAVNGAHSTDGATGGVANADAPSNDSAQRVGAGTNRDPAIVADVDDERLAAPLARPTTAGGPKRSNGSPSRPPASLARTSTEPGGGDERPPKRSWVPRLLGRGHPLGDDEAFWRNVRDDDADRAFWDADDAPDDDERDPRDQTGTAHAADAGDASEPARQRSSAASGPPARP